MNGLTTTDKRDLAKLEAIVINVAFEAIYEVWDLP